MQGNSATALSRGELVHLYAASVIAPTLSFLFAGLLWYSHHLRLMQQAYGRRPVVFANLFFLLSIILVPVISRLDGAYGQSGVIAVLYGFRSPANSTWHPVAN